MNSKIIKQRDYKAPNFVLQAVNLDFFLKENNTYVKNRMKFNNIIGDICLIESSWTGTDCDGNPIDLIGQENLEDLTNLGPGMYSVLVTDDNECPISIIDIEIIEPEEMTILQVSSEYNGCYGISCNVADDGSIDLSVSGGTANYTYAWTKTGDNSFSATTQDLSNLSPGTYNVTVTDANDCTTTNSFEITEPAELLIADAGLSTEIACFGDNGQIRVNVTQASVANYTYALYQGNSVVQTVTNSNLNHTFSAAAGTYKVRVTDANGCFKETNNITLTQPDAALSISNETINNIDCKDQDNGSIDITVAGGTANYTYAWTKTGDNSYSATSQDLSSLSPGTYHVTITDANNCEGTVVWGGRWEEVVDSGVVVTIDGVTTDPASCFNSNDGEAFVQGGLVSGFTYTWETNIPGPPAGFPNGDSPSGIVVASGSSFNNFYPGNYWVVAHYSDSASSGLVYSGCDVAEPFTISSPSEIQTNLTNPQDVSCYGDNDGEIDLIVNGGVSPYLVQWDTTTSLPNGSNSLLINNLQPGTYTVNIYDSDGCTVTQDFIIL